MDRFKNLMIDEAIMEIQHLATRDYIVGIIGRDVGKKPYIFNSDSDSEARCKSCDGDVSDEYRFCPQCGQRLIWEDDENES